MSTIRTARPRASQDSSTRWMLGIGSSVVAVVLAAHALAAAVLTLPALMLAAVAGAGTALAGEAHRRWDPAWSAPRSRLPAAR